MAISNANTMLLPLSSTETVVEDHAEAPSSEQLEIEETQRLKSLEADLIAILAFKHWQGLSKAEYIHLGPALRLASRLIVSDRALVFWHAFCAGPRESKCGTGGVDYQSFHRVYKNQHAKLPAQEQQQTRGLLDTFEGVIEFEMKDLQKPETAGQCRMLEDQQVTRDGKVLRGHPSIISVNKPRFYALFPETELGDQSYKQSCLTFATTLVHELAHAVSYAKQGTRAEEFFEDYAFTEMGHAVTTWLFGGEIISDFQNPKILVVEKFPSRTIAEIYRDIGQPYPLAVEIDDLPARQLKVISESEIDWLMGPWYGDSPPRLISSWRFTTGPLELDRQLRRAYKSH